MKGFLIFLVTVVCASCAMQPAFASEPPRFELKVQDPTPEPSPWSAAFFHSFQKKETAAVALARIDTFEDFLGVRWLDLDLSGMAGAYVESGEPVAGVTIGKHFALDKGQKLGGYIGLGVSAPVANWTPKDLGIGLTLGLSYRF